MIKIWRIWCPFISSYDVWSVLS